MDMNEVINTIKNNTVKTLATGKNHLFLLREEGDDKMMVCNLIAKTKYLQLLETEEVKFEVVVEYLSEVLHDWRATSFLDKLVCGLSSEFFNSTKPKYYRDLNSNTYLVSFDGLLVTIMKKESKHVATADAH